MCGMLSEFVLVVPRWWWDRVVFLTVQRRLLGCVLVGRRRVARDQLVAFVSKYVWWSVRGWTHRPPGARSSSARYCFCALDRQQRPRPAARRHVAGHRAGGVRKCH